MQMLTSKFLNPMTLLDHSSAEMTGIRRLQSALIDVLAVKQLNAQTACNAMHSRRALLWVRTLHRQ
jgi:hypothetical protein